MNGRGKTAAERALAMVGVPFRLGGRDPRFGLDCVGLILASYALAPPRVIPRRASLSANDRAPWEAGLVEIGFERLSENHEPADGDVLLLDVGHGRRHLALRAGGHICHGHAGLGQVVAGPLPAPSQILSSWRLRATDNLQKAEQEKAFKWQPWS